jgi:hypothetical protein
MENLPWLLLDGATYHQHMATNVDARQELTLLKSTSERLLAYRQTAAAGHLLCDLVTD